MTRPYVLLLLILALACGCRRPSQHDSGPARGPGASWPTLAEQLRPTDTVDQGPGEDDGSSPSQVAAVVLAPYESWQHIPAPQGAHPVVCDIAWFADAAWVSFGNRTISTDGARIYSWQPDRGWKLEFDWDRGGAPGITHEQGGQGITRLRVIGETLYATDADAPNFAGFGLSGAPLEGYIFLATAEGFGQLGEGQTPPRETILVPLAFHVFDVARYRGRLVASGGTLAPPGARSRYPGGLFVGAPDGPLLPQFWPGKDTAAGVVRTTFLHRFRGRLYAGFQSNRDKRRWDLGVVDGDPLSDGGRMVLGRVTPEGGWRTRHFASDGETLYWIASSRSRGGASALFRSRDGLHFDEQRLGDDVGEPHDALAHDSNLLVLSDTGLWAFDASGRRSLRLPAPTGKPFHRRDGFCSTPMTASRHGLFVGSTNGQGIYLAKP